MSFVQTVQKVVFNTLTGTVVSLTLLMATADAGGKITAPKDGNLRAGTPIRPTCSVDPVHEMNGDEYHLTVRFNRAGDDGSEQDDNEYRLGAASWKVDNDVYIPGGEYIGGTWHVVLMIDGTVAAVNCGYILPPD